MEFFIRESIEFNVMDAFFEPTYDLLPAPGALEVLHPRLQQFIAIGIEKSCMKGMRYYPTMISRKMNYFMCT